jgi:DNA polymerase-3 subunit epsilon
MISTPIHVIDFEGSRQSGIVEYGVATVEGASITAVHTRICAPVGTISDQDRMQHGISEEAASEHAPFADEWPLFSGLRQQGPFCAHNVTVEDGFLRAVWSYPKECPDFAEPGVFAADWGPWLDTLSLYRRVYPGLDAYGLEDLVKVFDLQDQLDEQAGSLCPSRRRRYHCALYDAMASALLLLRALNEPELESASLRWWIIQSAGSEARRESITQQKLF